MKRPGDQHGECGQIPARNRSRSVERGYSSERILRHTVRSVERVVFFFREPGLSSDQVNNSHRREVRLVSYVICLVKGDSAQLRHTQLRHNQLYPFRSMYQESHQEDNRHRDNAGLYRSMTG